MLAAQTQTATPSLPQPWSGWIAISPSNYAFLRPSARYSVAGDQYQCRSDGMICPSCVSIIPDRKIPQDFIKCVTEYHFRKDTLPLCVPLFSKRYPHRVLPLPADIVI